MDGITFQMMMEPAKHGLVQCPHCSGYGSSLRESDSRCSQCGGTGLVRISCPDCGSSLTSGPDDEGLIDCCSCGIWFEPNAILRQIERY